MAKRLAENPKISVAIIEAGSFYEITNGNLSQIPAYDVYYSSASPSSIQPLVDWGDVTIPQAVCMMFCQLPQLPFITDFPHSSSN